MGNGRKKGRFVKLGAAVQYQQRLRNIRKSKETGNDSLPSFDTDSDLFSTDFTCNPFYQLLAANPFVIIYKNTRTYLMVYSQKLMRTSLLESFVR